VLADSGEDACVSTAAIRANMKKGSGIPARTRGPASVKLTLIDTPDNIVLKKSAVIKVIKNITKNINRTK